MNNNFSMIISANLNPLARIGVGKVPSETEASLEGNHDNPVSNTLLALSLRLSVEKLCRYSQNTDM